MSVEGTVLFARTCVSYQDDQLLPVGKVHDISIPAVFVDARQYQFCVAKPDSQTVPFYDNENRIAEIICGTLADYDIEENLISKDKFDEVVQGLMADNKFVKVYRFFIEGDNVHMGTIEIKSYKDDKEG